MPEQTDEDIAGKVQVGDSQSFGLLIERYEQKLLRYAHKFLFSHEDGQDVVQDTFLKAYENIKSFDRKKKFSPWIYRIAHNTFINAMKKRTRHPIFSFDLDTIFPHLISAQTSDAGMLEDDAKKMLDMCLEKLSAKYREPLVLYYSEELGYKEIAEILHIPVSTVGVRLQRGKHMLKKIMKKLYPAYE